MFIDSSKLKKHILAVHEDHKCESCGKSFNQATYLKKHILIIHEGRKDYKCETCGYRTGDASALTRHIYHVHEGQRDFQCQICQKWFARPKILKSHIKKIHEAKKDFKCDICGKICKKAGYLKLHRAACNGKRDYCDLCENTFHNLKYHISFVHEGQGNCKCNICGKHFTSMGILKRHINIFHEGHNDHKCEFCEKSFLREAYLRNHININHNNSNKDIEKTHEIFFPETTEEKSENSMEQEDWIPEGKNVGSIDDVQDCNNTAVTKVKIIIVHQAIDFTLNIPKESHLVKLADVKNIMPKKHVKSINKYYSKIIDEETGIGLFEHWVDDFKILPLFENQIILKCYS